MFVGSFMWLSKSMLIVLPAAKRSVGPTYVLLYVAAHTFLPATSTWAWSTFSVIFTLLVVDALASGGSWNGCPDFIPRSCSSVEGGGIVVDVVGPATVVEALGCCLADECELPHATATSESAAVRMQTRATRDSRIIEPVRPATANSELRRRFVALAQA